MNTVLQVMYGYVVGEEPMKHATQMQIYVRRWRPSTFTVDKTHEVILDENTPEHLKVKISDFSGIPVERVMFAKASSFVVICLLRKSCRYNSVFSHAGIWFFSL